MGLDFGQNGAGKEKVLMWYFEELMYYRLLNPCKIVYVYDNHCVPVKLVQYTRQIITERALLLFFLRDDFDSFMRRIYDPVKHLQ